MSEFDLEEFLEECKKNFGCTLVSGGKWNGKFYKLAITDRVDFFIFFLERLKEVGKPKEYLNAGVRRIIIKNIIPKGKKYEDPEGGWVRSTEADLKKAIPIVFPTEGQEKLAEKQNVSKVTNPDEPGYDWKNAPIWDPEKHRAETGEPVIEDIVDPEMAELLGYNRKDE